MNVTDNDRKKALLFHLAGETVFDVFEGLMVSEIAEDADPLITNSCTVAKAALDNHFNPKKTLNLSVIRFVRPSRTLMRILTHIMQDCERYRKNSLLTLQPKLNLTFFRQVVQRG